MSNIVRPVDLDLGLAGTRARQQASETTWLQVSPFGALQSDGRDTLRFAAKHRGHVEVHNPGAASAQRWVYFPLTVPSTSAGTALRITGVRLWHQTLWQVDVPLSRVTELEVRQTRRNRSSRVLMNSRVDPANAPSGWAMASAYDEGTPPLTGSPWVRVQLDMVDNGTVSIGEIQVRLSPA